MLIEAIARPIRYCLVDGKQVHLTPGIPTDLPEPQAQILLQKAVGQVRLVAQPPLPREETITIQAAPCQRPVWWKSASGQILGPAQVTHFAQVTDSQGRDLFWLCLDYQGSWHWVREDRLRAKGSRKRDPKFCKEGQPYTP